MVLGGAMNFSIIDDQNNSIAEGVQNDLLTGVESPTVIKVVGCGGAGGNAVTTMVKSNITNVEFIALNTDAQALSGTAAQTKFIIGKEVTRGLGCGADPALGEKSAEEDAEKIKGLLKGADMVFVTAGMGGGTGTGSAPVVARIAKELGALTVAVVTKPFDFEGPQRMRNALTGIEKLRKNVDSLIVIPNQKIMDPMNSDLPFGETFKMCDDVLCQGVQGISEIITKIGYINRDFNDVKTTLKDKGNAIFGIGVGTGGNRAIDAATSSINNPLLEDTKIDGASNILFNITCGPDCTTTEIREIANHITGQCAKDALVLWGQVIDPTMKDKIKVTVIAAGFNNGMNNEVDSDDEKPAVVFVEKPKVQDENVLSKDVFDGLLHTPTSMQNNVPGELFENHQSDSLLDNNRQTSSSSMNVTEEEKNGLLGDALFGDSSNETPRRRSLFNPPDGYTGEDDLGKPAIWSRNKEFGRTINLTDK
jgi:cell division protein FtsZ